MKKPAQRTAVRVHPLNDFADRWELDGDYIRCRCCNRPQQVSYALHDFPHASRCKNAESAERDPWKTLNSLITAQIANAKEPAMAEEEATDV
jgi:hypothetical protein